MPRNQSWLLAPEQYFRRELATGQLCRLDVQDPSLVIELSAIELKGRSRSPALQALIELCQAYLSTLDTEERGGV